MDGDIIKEHNSCFTRWFKQKLLSYPLHEDSSAEEQLIFALSQGAEHSLMTYEAYDINGYTFCDTPKIWPCFIKLKFCQELKLWISELHFYFLKSFPSL